MDREEKDFMLEKIMIDYGNELVPQALITTAVAKSLSLLPLKSAYSVTSSTKPVALIVIFMPVPRIGMS